jgi:hypothetical protein
MQSAALQIDPAALVGFFALLSSGASALCLLLLLLGAMRRQQQCATNARSYNVKIATGGAAITSSCSAKEFCYCHGRGCQMSTLFLILDVLRPDETTFCILRLRGRLHDSVYDSAYDLMHVLNARQKVI